MVLVAFPFTDLSSSKRRPALVISPDSLNARQEDLILAAITSQVTQETGALRISEQDLSEGTLPKPSVVKPTKLFTIHSALVVKKIGTLRVEKVNEVLTTTRDLFS